LNLFRESILHGILASFAFLESNNLEGFIPEEIKAVTSLEVLYLSDNKLTEELPAIFGALENLIEFDVERNLLQGNPWTDVVNSPSLQSLKLSSNFFTGTIPSEISSLTGLTELWLAENRIEGSLPSAIGSLTNLGKFTRPLEVCVWLHWFQILFSHPFSFWPSSIQTRFTPIPTG